MTAVLQAIRSRLFGEPVRLYCDYYHFVVGEASLKQRAGEPFADALLIRAYKDIYVDVDQCGMWNRRDQVPEQLRALHAQVFPLYVAAKRRQQRLE